MWHKDEKKEIRNWDDPLKCGQILADGDKSNTQCQHAVEDAFVRRKVLSGRLEVLTVSDWKCIFLPSAHEPGRGLIDKLIPDTQLQKDMDQNIRFMFEMCQEIYYCNKITCNDLGSMVKHFLRGVEAVGKYYRYVASSPNEGACVARLNDQADQLLPSFKSKIKTKVLRKEVQHWAIAAIEVCDCAAHARMYQYAYMQTY